MSNGAYVTGTRRPDWRIIDLAELEAILTINGTVVAQKKGGHSTKDPLLPAIALVNALRSSSGVQAGQFITTGTYIDMYYARPGDHVSVSFVVFLAYGGNPGDGVIRVGLVGAAPNRGWAASAHIPRLSGPAAIRSGGSLHHPAGERRCHRAGPSALGLPLPIGGQWSTARISTSSW